MTEKKITWQWISRFSTLWEIYPHFVFGKNFVKSTYLLKKLLNTWFDEIFFREQIFDFSTLYRWVKITTRNFEASTSWKIWNCRSIAKVAYAEKWEIQILVLNHEDENFKRWRVNLTHLTHLYCTTYRALTVHGNYGHLLSLFFGKNFVKVWFY